MFQEPPAKHYSWICLQKKWWNENAHFLGAVQGFPKKGICEGGGEISIIGVVRTLVAIINFAANHSENF